MKQANLASVTTEVDSDDEFDVPVSSAFTHLKAIDKPPLQRIKSNSDVSEDMAIVDSIKNEEVPEFRENEHTVSDDETDFQSEDVGTIDQEVKQKNSALETSIAPIPISADVTEGTEKSWSLSKMLGKLIIDLLQYSNSF